MAQAPKHLFSKLYSSYEQEKLDAMEEAEENEGVTDDEQSSTFADFTSGYYCYYGVDEDEEVSYVGGRNRDIGVLRRYTFTELNLLNLVTSVLAPSGPQSQEMFANSTFLCDGKFNWEDPPDECDGNFLGGYKYKPQHNEKSTAVILNKVGYTLNPWDST